MFGVPCLTLRTTGERPVTVAEGTNRLVDPFATAALVGAGDEVLAAPLPDARRRVDRSERQPVAQVVMCGGCRRCANRSCRRSTPRTSMSRLPTASLTDVPAGSARATSIVRGGPKRWWARREP